MQRDGGGGGGGVVTCNIDLICDNEENKGHRHVTLPFLKIDMRHGEFPIKGPKTHEMRTARKKPHGLPASERPAVYGARPPNGLAN